MRHSTSTTSVLRAIGLARLPPPSRTPGWVEPLTVFAAGLISGAAFALLVTPRTGEQVRHGIAVAARRVGHDAKDAANQVKDVANRISAQAAAAVPGRHELAEEIPTGEAVHAAIDEGMPPLASEASNHVRGKGRRPEA